MDGELDTSEDEDSRKSYASGGAAYSLVEPETCSIPILIAAPHGGRQANGPRKG